VRFKLDSQATTLLTLVLALCLILATALPADASTTTVFMFNVHAHLPSFPCPSACNVSSLSGPFVGAIAGTGPNGVTVCATCSVGLSPTTVSLTYREPACVLWEVSASGTASGDVTISGGSSVLGGHTPLILHISYVRIGAVATVTFKNTQIGVAVGLFRATNPKIPPCDGSSQDVQIIGAGSVEDLG
jgi:hypothetical protein